MKSDSKKVIIGIISKHRDSDRDLKRMDFRIRDEVKQAVFDNGAIAIGILSPNSEVQWSGDNWLKYDNLILKEDIISQIELCDGIILQGGDANEAYEAYIAKYCYENDIPCLGICAGQNNMVRALGGTIKKIPNPDKHDRYFDDYVHSIEIDESSRFYDIVKTKSMMVNSRHKRTVETCPKLDKVAFCEDGYPDVVEAKDKNFYIGVRFHPESLYKIDKNMNNIFINFIECAKIKKIK